MSICSSQSWAVGLLKTICAMKLQNDADWDLARPESVCVDVKSTGGRSQAGPDSPSYQPGGICRRFTWGGGGGEGVSPEGESQLETDFEHFLSVMMRTFV